MRYLVKARLVACRERALLRAIEEGSLGRGSVAAGEYERNLESARLDDDGIATWVEVCYCTTPLEEERPYWEEFFELVEVKDAHSRRKCRDLTGEESWACSSCDCTEKLEERLAAQGRDFLDSLGGDRTRRSPSAGPARGE